MNGFLLLLAAGLPIAALFLLMVVFKKSAVAAAPISFFTTIAVASLIWKVPSIWLGASFVKGAMITLEILLIVFGAILLLSFLEVSGLLKTIESVLAGISKDRRIQGILVGWFFVSFIEGAAGFGAPAALAAPLLASIGFPPIAAVVTALIGDSTAVTFGAVGVPITIGIMEGLGTIFGDVAEVAASVAVKAAFIHMIAGAFVPLMISVALTWFFGKSFRRGLEIWPYAILAGLCFTIPYYFIALFLGPEFPSILGALFGGTIMVALTKARIFKIREIWRFPGESEKEIDLPQATNLFKAVLPYLTIIGLLIVTRMDFGGVGGYLKSFSFDFQAIFNTSVSHNLPIFYSPGFLFILTTVVFGLIYRLKSEEVKEITWEVFSKIKRPAIALVFILGMVQILINSDANLINLPSMPVYLVGFMTGVGDFWILIAPFVGAFGSFIAGSSTVSNLLFSAFQAETALAFNLSAVLVLALQVVGSAIGNMIAVHNVVAALATVGLSKGEGTVIEKNLLPAALYLLIAVAVAVLFFLR